MIVYKITNKINGKAYIGQTTQPMELRWLDHCKKGHALYNAIKKYGKEAFELRILAKCNTMEEMNHREVYYIKLFNTLAPNGYNLKNGGNNKKYTLEARLNMARGQGSKPFITINLDTLEEKMYNTQLEAKLDGFHSGSICYCLKRKLKKSKNHVFILLENLHLKDQIIQEGLDSKFGSVKRNLKFSRGRGVLGLKAINVKTNEIKIYSTIKDA